MIFYYYYYYTFLLLQNCRKNENFEEQASQFLAALGQNSKTYIRPSNQTFPNLEIDFGFHQKLGVFISKQEDWSRKQGLHCSTVLIYIKGLNKGKFLSEEISSYKFDKFHVHFSMLFWK